MATIHRLRIDPPLMNSSCAWASDFHQIQELYRCEFTGAVTTRTATEEGFPEDPSIHTVAFLAESQSSVNSYGYSPHTLEKYLGWVCDLLMGDPHGTKPIILSITASSAPGLATMLQAVQTLRHRMEDNVGAHSRIAVELNTSCPNIAGKPPPAYAPEALHPFLDVLAAHARKDRTLVIGLKMPPYVHAGQFADVVHALAELSVYGDDAAEPWHPIAFLTCTNTLGSSLLFAEQTSPLATGAPPSGFALPTPLGGLAGDALHALALGNVHTFAQLFAAHEDPAMRSIALIGVGGVTSRAAASRMRRAGAQVIACATALGQEGVSVFERLSRIA